MAVGVDAVVVVAAIHRHRLSVEAASANGVQERRDIQRLVTASLLDQLDAYNADLLSRSETLGIPPLKIGHPEIPGILF